MALDNTARVTAAAYRLPGNLHGEHVSGRRNSVAID
jgi:hypothetical protein